MALRIRALEIKCYDPWKYLVSPPFKTIFRKRNGNRVAEILHDRANRRAKENGKREEFRIRTKLYLSLVI